MRTTKIIRKILTLEDPADIYSGSIDNTLIKLMNDQWSMKCMNGVYILSADKIIQRSECIVNNRSLEGDCTVSVEMEVSILYYEKSNLITGKVVAIYPEGDIVLTNDFASITIGSSQATSSVKLGDIIPLYVIDSRYPLGKPKISIIGIPFVPLYNDDIYLLVSGETIDVSPMLATIKAKSEEVNSLSKSKPHVAAHFIALLYPYKRKSSVKNCKPLANIVNAEGIISRTSALYGSLQYTEHSKLTIPTITMDKTIVIEKILSSVITELDNIKMLIESYDKESIKNLSHIWKIYSMYKR